MTQASIENQYVVFQLQQVDFALPLDCVREALLLSAVTALPEAPAWLAGVLNYRGQVIPVIDLRLRLGFPAGPYQLNTPMLVIQTGAQISALIPDSLDNLYQIPPESRSLPEELPRLIYPVASIARLAERLVILLDPALLTTGLEGLDLDQLAAEVFSGIDPRD